METIKIDSLAYKGYGVGRINSKVVFVDYACPGDVLKIEIYDEHKHYAFGKIIEIVSPSQNRITPVCKHFGICGGCNYLHISYKEEVYQKSEIFKSEFNKIFKGIKDFDPVDLTDNFKNDGYLKYRQKIELKVISPFMGFYKKSSHDIVDIEYCCIAKDSINKLLKSVRGALLDGNYGNDLLNEISTVTLTDTGLKNITFGLNKYVPKQIPHYNLIFKDIIKKTGADNIFARFKTGKGNIIKYTGDNNNSSARYFTLKHKKFAYDLPSFIQINKEQNENIINTIRLYLANIKKNRGSNFNNVLDLFCGYGNITLFLSRYAKAVTGVEENCFSIKLGKKNLKLNDIKNISFVMSSVKEFLKKAVQRMINYDLIVIDPPRAGIKGLVLTITALNPSFIIYISCDMMTLLRDVKIFIDAGYTVEKINLIDMFPRTYHMEHTVFLRKNV